MRGILGLQSEELWARFRFPKDFFPDMHLCRSISRMSAKEELKNKATPALGEPKRTPLIPGAVASQPTDRTRNASKPVIEIAHLPKADGRCEQLPKADGQRVVATDRIQQDSQDIAKVARAARDEPKVATSGPDWKKREFYVQCLIAKIANESENSVIMEWDSQHDVLDIRDPNLFFFLRWA